jgi:hypothetical protein
VDGSGSLHAHAGLKAMWERSAIDSRAALFYDDVDEEGNPIAAPTRPNVSVNLQNHIEGANQALSDLEASIGMYRANLGAPSNETSGVAIDARKEQGEASTSHFPQNLASSLGQVGRICLQMTPKLIDTKRQHAHSGHRHEAGRRHGRPAGAQGVRADQEGVVLNPNVGTYDVRVVVGASYSTQRSQAQAALSEVMQRNPALTPAIAPLWAQNLDFPHADKLAQVLTAMAPEPVQAILNPEASNKPTVEQLMAKTQQMEQALQQATQHLQAIQQEATGLVQKLQEKDAKLQAMEADKHVEEFNAEHLAHLGAGRWRQGACKCPSMRTAASTRFRCSGNAPAGQAARGNCRTDGRHRCPRRKSPTNPQNPLRRVFLCPLRADRPKKELPWNSKPHCQQTETSRQASKQNPCCRLPPNNRASCRRGQGTTAEGEQTAEQKEAAKKPEKTPEQREIDRLRRRVDNLTKQKYTLAAQLPQGQAQPAQQTTQGSNDEPVTLSRAELQKLIAEQAQQLAPAVTEQRAVMEHRQAVVTKLAKDWGEQEFNAKAMDLDMAVGGLKDAQDRPKPVTDAIFEADDPKALIEYLIDPDNAAEAERLAGLPALRVGREIARIEAKLELAKKEAKPRPQQCRQAARSGQGRRCPQRDAGPQQHQGMDRVA